MSSTAVVSRSTRRATRPRPLATAPTSPGRFDVAHGTSLISGQFDLPLRHSCRDRRGPSPHVAPGPWSCPRALRGRVDSARRLIDAGPEVSRCRAGTLPISMRACFTWNVLSQPGSGLLRPASPSYFAISLEERVERLSQPGIGLLKPASPATSPSRWKSAWNVLSQPGSGLLKPSPSATSPSRWKGAWNVPLGLALRSSSRRLNYLVISVEGAWNAARTPQRTVPVRTSIDRRLNPRPARGSRS